MFRVGSWLSGRKPEASASMQFLDAQAESQALAHAMQAATLIMNDDVDGAQAGLSDGDSTFHMLGKGVVGFIRATLGFEQDIMRDASQRLNEVETSAGQDQHKANLPLRPPNAFRSEIYDPGTEYALCQAMAQVMGAVVGVLNESLTESIKGFYKLRKAFSTLNSISKMEEQYLISLAAGRQAGSSESSVGTDISSDANNSRIVKHMPESDLVKGTSSSEISLDSQEKEVSDTTLPQSGSVSPEEPASLSGPTRTLLDVLHGDPASPEFSTSIDVFIHSGTNLFYGLLLLLLSMVPPAFTRLLSIIGFHGDKEKGLRMLWRASSFHSLVGAIAGLVLLGYYNSIVNFCDIVADPVVEEDDEQVEGYPMERLSTLLTRMRARYPKSQLWVLEAARMKSANRDLAAAYELLGNGVPSPLKQVEALRTFEKSMDAMYLHRYEECAQSFVACVDLNSWSPSLYYYIAGSAHLVLYRQLKGSDSKVAATHAEKAEEYFLKAPTVAGKKRFMARQLPFDIFVTRKVAKWEARAREWKIDLVDAVGVDPIEEMIFFWNGHNRMTKELLHLSLERLAWSESDQNKNWSRESKDEKAAGHVLKAAVLRGIRKHGEAKEILLNQVLNHDKSEFKGSLKDDWILPVANFEMAANLWMERPSFVARQGPTDNELKPFVSRGSVATVNSPDQLKVEREKVRQCFEYLDKAAQWESYVLDTRIGLKVTAAKSALKKWEEVNAIGNDAL